MLSITLALSITLLGAGLSPAVNLARAQESPIHSGMARVHPTVAKHGMVATQEATATHGHYYGSSDPRRTGGLTLGIEAWLMEASAFPITTWVWLLAPMALVLALSIITFFMEDRD